MKVDYRLLVVFRVLSFFIIMIVFGFIGADLFGG
jgi:hypothetical protein